MQLPLLQHAGDSRSPSRSSARESGNGAHVWIFFDRPVSATNAGRLGCALLTRTMEDRHEIGLDSYDRFFPNQDSMPKGGFGNLIALPLQKCPREQGNTVILDEMFQPYPNQWMFLESVPGLSQYFHFERWNGCQTKKAIS
jgi:hypothetical protein